MMIYPIRFLEDHCDVIPFFRACWRKKMFPSKDLLFMHFDAHPDLAVPSTTAVEVCMYFEDLLNVKISLSFTLLFSSWSKVQSFKTVFLCITRYISIVKNCFLQIDKRDELSLQVTCTQSLHRIAWIGLDLIGLCHTK